ncbi:hypothetical protein DXG03_005528 [Asterophora parasitica]|uniref:Mediator of RNA polymerase II transcription subunit 8 n=1 Tax=Asterophora parasitica TaxID=117018 RepID=A0A9P7KEA2_9AGAR|nr:hypothetical protein DXG03_005528 [Asterophora parasitica]
MSTFHNPPSAGSGPPVSGPLTTSGLPISQLESLRFKASQIIDSIQSLQRTIEAGHMAAMPAWPDILSKYNILLSQTHSFSMGLTGTLSAPSTAQGSRAGGSGGSTASGNILERVALHPSAALTDAQLDGEVIPLLRNQQTTDVLRVENDTVRRLADHMVTKGSLGVLGVAGAVPAPPPVHVPFGMGSGARKPVEYGDVLAECEEIRGAHDRRVERAVRAVTMLRERFDWRARVEVEVEEPEELEWDPRIHPQVMDHDMDDGEDGEDHNGEDTGVEDSPSAVNGDVGMDDEGEGEGASSDEDEVQALVDSTMDMHSSPVTPTVPLLSNALANPTHGTTAPTS